MRKLKKAYLEVYFLLNNTLRKMKIVLILLKDIVIQNCYNLSELKKAKSVVLFFVPANKAMLGGIMAIFRFAKYSRLVNKEAFIAISTYPGKKTYSKNTRFPNQERIYRFEQFTSNCKFIDNLIVNIPESVACDFYRRLNNAEIKFLKSIKQLRINIMNQNIQLMPPLTKLESLKKLTHNITQTTGFEKYTTQEVCDRWGFPLYFLLPTFEVDYSVFKKAFYLKKNIFFYSPDEHPRKIEILQRLKYLLPKYKFVEIRNISYTKFLKFAAICKFAITFGEGFDGFIAEMHKLGGVGFAVYNEDFFPSKDFLDFENIFSSWDDLKNNIGNTITLLLNNPQKYAECSSMLLNQVDTSYKIETTINCLKDFYSNKPTFVPKNGIHP